MRKIFLAILVFCVFLLPCGAMAAKKAAVKNVKPKSYTLSAAVTRALQANPTIEQQVKALEAARMNVGVAQSYFWPRVSLVMQRSHLQNSGTVSQSDELTSDTYSYGLRLTFSLFAGFAHLNGLQQSLIRKEIAELTKKQAELELIANVRLQYFGYLQSKRNLRLMQDSIKRIELQVKASEEFAAEDLVPYVNVLQNRVDLAKAKEDLIRAQNNMDTFRIQLNRFLGYEPNEQIEFKGNLEDFPMNYKIDREKSLQMAMQRRPDVLIAQKSVAVARKQAWIAAGQALPQVDVTYDNMHFERDYESSRYKDTNRDYWNAGITFSWNIFEGGRTVFSTMAEKKHGDSLYAEFKNTVDGAKAEVLTSIMDLDAALKVYETAKENIAQATESYAQARYRYENGIGTVTELLNTQTKLTEAETNCSDAMARYQASYTRYTHYIGGLPDKK